MSARHRFGPLVMVYNHLLLYLPQSENGERTNREQPVAPYPSVCKAWINSLLLIYDSKLVAYNTPEHLYKLLSDSRSHI